MVVLAFGCGVAACLAATAAAQLGVPPPPPLTDGTQPGATPVKPLGGQLFGMYGQSFQQVGQSGPVIPQAEASEETPKDPKAKVEMFRKRYPFESLTKRLDYEAAGAAAFAKSEPPLTVTKQTLQRLTFNEALRESSRRVGLRAKALQLLHSDAAEKFIEVRNNFGVSRMPIMTSPTTVDLELAAAPSLPLAQVSREAPSAAKESNLPKVAELTAFHERGLEDFLDPRGFGFVKDRDHVAGFQAHQFRQMPTLPVSDKPPAASKEQWAVIRLQLVSLLKFDRPAVYISDNLPRMDELKGVPTRPLTPFEEKSLKALREGDDLGTETSGDRIRMVGSLRAGKQCLECHEVKRGDLLGAFSWELQRQPVDAKK